MQILKSFPENIYFGTESILKREFVQCLLRRSKEKGRNNDETEENENVDSIIKMTDERLNNEENLEEIVLECFHSEDIAELSSNILTVDGDLKTSTSENVLRISGEIV